MYTRSSHSTRSAACRISATSASIALSLPSWLSIGCERSMQHGRGCRLVHVVCARESDHLVREGSRVLPVPALVHRPAVPQVSGAAGDRVQRLSARTGVIRVTSETNAIVAMWPQADWPSSACTRARSRSICSGVAPSRSRIASVNPSATSPSPDTTTSAPADAKRRHLAQVVGAREDLHGRVELARDPERLLDARQAGDAHDEVVRRGRSPPIRASPDASRRRRSPPRHRRATRGRCPRSSR